MPVAHLAEATSHEFFTLVREAFASSIASFGLREVEARGKAPERWIVFRNGTTELCVRQEIGLAPSFEITEVRQASASLGAVSSISLERLLSLLGVAVPNAAPSRPVSYPPEALRVRLSELAALLSAHCTPLLSGDFSAVPKPDPP